MTHTPTKLHTTEGAEADLDAVRAKLAGLQAQKWGHDVSSYTGPRSSAHLATVSRVQDAMALEIAELQSQLPEYQEAERKRKERDAAIMKLIDDDHGDDVREAINALNAAAEKVCVLSGRPQHGMMEAIERVCDEATRRLTWKHGEWYDNAVATYRYYAELKAEKATREQSIAAE